MPNIRPMTFGTGIAAADERAEIGEREDEANGERGEETDNGACFHYVGRSALPSTTSSLSLSHSQVSHRGGGAHGDGVGAS